MKEVLIILDGLMEEGLDFSPTTWCDFSIPNRDIDSLTCIFNMLGYPSTKYDIGDRSYYEALAKDIKLHEGEVVLRCNIVKVVDGVLVDFTGGKLPVNIGEILQEIYVEKGVIHAGDTYKNLLVLKDFQLDDVLYPPHFQLGVNIDDLMPKEIRLKQIMQQSKKVFQKYGLYDCMLWPWGLSTVVKLPSFYEQHQKVGGVVSGIDLIHGMGLALGMHSIKPSGCTGYEETDLVKKLQTSLQLIPVVDVLLIHINGLDELAHQKNPSGKLSFLTHIKHQLIDPLLSQLRNTTVYITCDHRTDSQTGCHEKGNVPLWRINL